VPLCCHSARWEAGLLVCPTCGRVVDSQTPEVVPVVEALCLDCLRPVRASQLQAHDNNELCPCGGEVCPCEGCLAMLALLRAGVRGDLDGGLQSDRGPAWEWSEHRGTMG